MKGFTTSPFILSCSEPCSVRDHQFPCSQANKNYLGVYHLFSTELVAQRAQMGKAGSLVL